MGGHKVIDAGTEGGPKDRRFVHLVDYLQEAVDVYVRKYPDATRHKVMAALRLISSGVAWEAELEQHQITAQHPHNTERGNPL